MSNKKVIVGAVVLAVLVIVIGAAVLMKRAPSVSPGGGGEPEGVGASQTRTETPKDIVVPGKNAENLPENVAKPQIVGPAAPASQSSFRSFDLAVRGNEFVPNTVIVNGGDTVHLNIVAEDRNYDFTQPDYGLSAQLPKGQSRIIEFSASASGKFTFFCKSCGGPDKGPVGYIVVASK